MSTRHRVSMLVPFLSLSLLVALLLSACGGASTGSGGEQTGQTAGLKTISIGLGYIADIQFAPFYVAQSKGYYKAAGLNVIFHQGIVPDLIGSMVAGKSDFVFAGGDEELEARDKGVNVIDVATIYQKYPVSLIVPANSPIKTLADLKGHTIGVPGAYGSTYTGLLALLYKANLSTSDVKIQSIGFTQVAALAGHKVDAVMGYSNNEPIRLQQQGFAVRTFNVFDYEPLVSNGIIVTQQMYQSQPQIVREFVQATLKGVKDVIADPQGAITISKSYVPGLQSTPLTQTILNATIITFQGNGQLGSNDDATWQSMEKFLVAEKLIAPVQNLSSAYTHQSLS